MQYTGVALEINRRFVQQWLLPGEVCQAIHSLKWIALLLSHNIKASVLPGIQMSLRGKEYGEHPLVYKYILFDNVKQNTKFGWENFNFPVRNVLF
jgi:hypothetical protein